MKTIILGLFALFIANVDAGCGRNERPLQGGGCDCILGFARLDGKNCLRCPQNGHFQVRLNRCVCDFEFRPFNGRCIKKNISRN